MTMRNSLRALIDESLFFMLERFEQNPDDPFIDTKFDIVSGKDFCAEDAPFRQRNFIYSWIQGRGLESLAGHADDFEQRGDTETAHRLDRMVLRVLTAMESCRKSNGGRVYFAMNPAGKPHFPIESEHANFSDLFYSKGLFAAARRLNLPELAEEAATLFRFVIDEIAAGNFHTDQHGFDPKNPVSFVPGKYSQGPMMIALYGLANFGAAHPEQEIWLDRAAEFIRFIFRYHINLNPGEELKQFDFIESLDANRRPWRDNGDILCDPGHALEFVGLASKCLLEMRRQNRHTALLAEAATVLPGVFRHIFDLGFLPAGGIVKSYNLTQRQAQNSDMPWWSLPETMRAGAELLSLWPELCDGIEQRVAKAQAAFLDGFIAAGTHGFACQTRDKNGVAVNVIPAVPDADPGYHTNLSLLDYLKL